MLRFLGVLFLAMLAALPACTAPIPAAAPTWRQPLTFDRFGTREGLPSSWVRDVTQDAQGFLWIATSDGLCRYDGIGFRVYRPGDGTGLPEHMVMKLLVDRDGRLLVGFEHRGVALYDPRQDRFQALDLGAGRSAGTVTHLVQDPAGTVWIGTLDGLFGMDPRSLRLEREPAVPRGFVTGLAVAADGALWIGGHGLLRREPGDGRMTAYTAENGGVPDNAVASCFVDRAGVVWAGNRHGALFRLPRGGTRFEQVLHLQGSGAYQDAMWTLHEDRRGQLWIGTSSLGFLVLDAQRGLLRHERPDPARPSGLSSSSVTCIFEDRGGVVWLGTDLGGLHKLSPLREQFQHLRVGPGGLRHPVVRAILQLPDGRLLVGTQGGGLHVFSARGRLDQVLYDDPRDGLSNAYALLLDHRGQLWVGGVDALARLDPATLRGRRLPIRRLAHAPVGKAEIQVLQEDREGRIWAGASIGLLRVEPGADTAVQVPLDIRGGLPSTPGGPWVQALLQERAGGLWIGTMFGGLLHYDPASGSVTRRFHAGNGLNSDFVTALHEDRKGRLWVATKGGWLACCLDRQAGRFRTYGEAQGLPHPNLYGILEEAVGALWISSDKGLCRLDPETGTTRVYRAADGLQDDEFNRFSFHRARGGQMFFGGVNGLNAFDPTQLPGRSTPPVVRLVGFQQFGRPARPPAAEGLELGHGARFFAFEFAALDYLDPTRNRYQYRMEPFDPDWYEGRVATYTNLPPGRYLLRVRAANADGVWNEDGLRLPVVLRPPWWRTPWAFGGAALAVLSALAAIYRLRTLQLRRDKRRLEALVGERTREVAAHAATLERTNHELRYANTRLTTALAEVRTLQGLIPICAQCKKIRDDRGIWNQIEGYLSDHADVQFSHGVCPDCAAGIRAELAARKDRGPTP